MRRFKIISAILATLGFSVVNSCVDEVVMENDHASGSESDIVSPIMTKSSATEISYDTLPNPYALDVMQTVYNTYSQSTVTLEPTDYYVKFMPKNRDELQRLRTDYDLELFDYPLDIQLDPGEEYVNTNLPETDLVWLYTTVESDFVFPNDISYQILCECYIPEDEEVIEVVPTKAGDPSVINVKEKAFQSCGYEVNVGTKAMYIPHGRIYVQENATTEVPLKGVKVKCRTIVDFATDYTDENGWYTMDKSFLVDPTYVIEFANEKDFSIWDNWGPLSTATYNMGTDSSAGHYETIGINSSEWVRAVVNNSAYEYYEMCEQTGILLPPSDLIIWIWNWHSGSCAPMLRRIEDYIGLNTNYPILNYVVNFFYGDVATELNQTLKVALPDIIIGPRHTNDSLFVYKKLYKLLNHELSHASHFSKVGSPFWAKYISYIMTYGAYGGNSDGANAELCAIGEMWGNFMGSAQILDKYGPTDTLSKIDTVDGWIYPQVFGDLYKDVSPTQWILQKKQIYDCLLPEVDTYDELVSTLYMLYPHKALQIKQVLDKYPEVNHSVSLPDYDNMSYDAYCLNQNITTSLAITGNNVFVDNTTVGNGATLNLNVGSAITIDKPFMVDRQASLIIIGDAFSQEQLQN